MRVLYLDLSMGAAGDMISAALLELCPEKEKMLETLNALGIPHLEYVYEKKSSHGISGAHLNVKYLGHSEGEEHHHHEEEHHHHHMGHGDIDELISSLSAPDCVKARAREIYRSIAKAESEVHGQAMTDIHFHELGTMDAVADVMAACTILHSLDPDRVICSPIRLGYGTVRCAHGILPVPAPATALLIRGLETFAGDIEGEMCTPTGAAIIKNIADEFGSQPQMTVEQVGCGIGTKDFGRANCVRALLGEQSAQVTELVAVVDDMSGEDLGYAMETLRKAGALDVCWEPVGMKKSRPGLRLCCLCSLSDRDKMLELIFRHTSTIGVRELLCSRYVLKRESGLIQTNWGPVREKTSAGYGVIKTKIESDDLIELAQKSGEPIEKIRKLIAGGRSDA